MSNTRKPKGSIVVRNFPLQLPYPRTPGRRRRKALMRRHWIVALRAKWGQA